MRRTPATYATGIDSSRSARARSVAIRTGRRDSRSTHAPAKNPTSRVARLAATTRRAISNGPAPSTSRATSGIAVRVTTEPRAEIVWPAQSFMKSEWRHRDSSGISGGAYRPEPDPEVLPMAVTTPNPLAEVRLRTQMFAGGDFLDAVSGRTYAVENPANGQTIAEVAEGGVEDVDRAVEAARR